MLVKCPNTLTSSSFLDILKDYTENCIIENLWAIVKKRLAKQSVSWEKLEEKVQEFWNSIELETVQKLYDSIPERLEAVASSNGFISRFSNSCFDIIG